MTNLRYVIDAHLSSMTVSMRVMSAGDGYKYLLKSVAAGERSLSTPLTRDYAEAGFPPGFWIGLGLAALGDGQLIEGSRLSEGQLQLLIGMGCDPLTGEPLGRTYQPFATEPERVGQRIADLDPEMGPAGRARAVAAIEGEEAQRGTRARSRDSTHVQQVVGVEQLVAFGVECG